LVTDKVGQATGDVSLIEEFVRHGFEGFEKMSNADLLASARDAGLDTAAVSGLDELEAPSRSDAG
jgi:hypothetical protein